MKLFFPDGEHPQVLIGQGAVQVGSDTDANIVLALPDVVARHAELIRNGDVLTLHALEGAVSVNGEALTAGGEAVLKPGDRIIVEGVQKAAVGAPVTPQERPEAPPEGATDGTATPVDAAAPGALSPRDYPQYGEALRARVWIAAAPSMERGPALASDLDDASKRQLERGARLMELLRQPQYSPMPMEEQVAVIWAGTTGQLDEVPVEDVQRFEEQFLDYLRHNSDLLTTIAQTGTVGDAEFKLAGAQIASFKRTFRTASGVLLGEPDADEVTDSDIEQQQIVKRNRG